MGDILRFMPHQKSDTTTQNHINTCATQRLYITTSTTHYGPHRRISTTAKIIPSQCHSSVSAPLKQPCPESAEDNDHAEQHGRRNAIVGPRVTRPQPLHQFHQVPQWGKLRSMPHPARQRLHRNESAGRDHQYNHHAVTNAGCRRR